jgi:predicted nucleic acid-binding protein
MKPTVYLETTIPSFYYEDRADIAAVARREWTRQWWDERRQEYELYTSIVVVDELRRGNYPSKELCLAMVSDLPLIALEAEVLDIVEVYMDHQVMPRSPTGDALHLALASSSKCDFLLTWNCQHLANANKFGHIRRINALLGLFVPSIVTPLELLGGQSDD